MCQLESKYSWIGSKSVDELLQFDISNNLSDDELLYLRNVSSCEWVMWQIRFDNFKKRKHDDPVRVQCEEQIYKLNELCKLTSNEMRKRNLYKEPTELYMYDIDDIINLCTTNELVS